MTTISAGCKEDYSELEGKVPASSDRDQPANATKKEFRADAAGDETIVTHADLVGHQPGSAQPGAVSRRHGSIDEGRATGRAIEVLSFLLKKLTTLVRWSC